jgi:hypothetical protein
VARAACVLAIAYLVAACSRTYHPDYHPETSYTYVEHATYVQNAIFAASGGAAGKTAKKGNDPIGRRAGSTPALSPSESIGRRAGSTPSESIGSVDESGAVVIYGDFNGNIYLGR